jgi:adenylate kinase family enzyme
MKPITCIFFGKSGAGKGTQASLLLKTFERIDPTQKALYVETGQRFRTFMESSSFVAKRTKEVLAKGGLLPPFLPIWTWTGFFVDEMKTGTEHMVFDGVCRQPEEAPILDTALQFIGRDKPIIILLDVHHEEAKTRLLKRGRYDDQHDKIKERLHWFETNVTPAIDYFRKASTCKFVHINGDQTIEKVHEDVLKALGIAGRL